MRRENEGSKQEKTGLRIKQFSTKRMKLVPSSNYIDIQNTGIGNSTLNRITPKNNNKARRLTQQQIDEIKSRYNKGNNNITKKVKEGRKTQKISMIKRNWELHEEKDNKQIQENLYKR